VAFRLHCPNCGQLDWFEWKFLGKFTDPVCGHSWYAGSGAYTMAQIRAVFQAGGRTAKYMTSSTHGEGAWVARIVGWFCGVLFGLSFRLVFAVPMIPIQAAVALLQDKKPEPKTVPRIAVLVITLAVAGVIYYQIQQYQNALLARPVGHSPAVAAQLTVQQPPGLIAPPAEKWPTVFAVSGFGETFTHVPDYTDKWAVASQTGSPTVTYSYGNFRIQASNSPNPGEGITFKSTRAFSGDLDAGFEFNHSGFGRTSVGLWSKNQNEGLIWGVLDTDDTAYLAFASGHSSTEYKYSNAPYMNKWITIGIQVVGDQVYFYANDGTGLRLLQTLPAPKAPTPDAYYLVFGASSVAWKAGPNDTSFRRITISSSAPAEQQAPVEPPNVLSTNELSQTPLASDPSLISYYRFEGNSADSKGNNGTDTAIAYSTANGRFGQGAGFASSFSSVISRATTFGLPLGNSPVSINLWFQTSSTSPTGQNLLSWGNNVPGQKTAVFIDGRQHVLFTPWGGQIQNTSKTVTDGLWHMATFTWDGGSTGVVYVDGSSAGSTGNQGFFGLNTAPGYFQIGGNMNGGSAFFNGNIDDVAIFSRALNPTEVSRLYSGF
jgi:hypothetical protein